MPFPSTPSRRRRAFRAGWLETLDGHPMTTIGGILTGLVHLSRALGFAAEPATDIGTRMVLEVVTIDVAGMRLGNGRRRTRTAAGDHGQADRSLPVGGRRPGRAAMMGDGSVALVLEPLAAVRGALSRVGRTARPVAAGPRGG